MTQQPIDTATVQRCIEALKGSGRYDCRPLHNELFPTGSPPAQRIETWTYTTHPMDILKGLLPPPEKSEAEKLVDEWLESSNPNDSYAGLAQFILDKQRSDNPVEVLRDIATDFAEEHGYTVDHKSFDAAATYGATPVERHIPNRVGYHFIGGDTGSPYNKINYGIAKRDLKRGDVVSSADLTVVAP